MAKKTAQETNEELEFSTFYVGSMLMGIDIRQIQEINRQFELTPVPHAPDCVRGVANLRGEVVTVVELRTVLGLPSQEVTHDSRTLIIKTGEEQVGLLVDRIADVAKVNTADMEESPANLKSVDGRFIEGVYKLNNELLVVLRVNEVLKLEECAR